MIYLFSNTTLQNHKILVVKKKEEFEERKTWVVNKCERTKKSDTILANSITRQYD